jgi:MOSC domain-containing protein YiiM
MDVRVAHIYISPEHACAGPYEDGLGPHPMREVREVECVAGRGLVGDRFFDHKPHKYPGGYHGQVTVFEDVARQLGVTDRPASRFRRKMITRGVDLNALIGREFEIQGVRFHGTEEASPCRWMEVAFAPGAMKALVGRGGLRAKILSSGTLRADAQ